MPKEFADMIEEIVNRLRAEGVQIDDLQKLRVAVGFKNDHRGEVVEIDPPPRKQSTMLRVMELGTCSTREIAERTGISLRRVQQIRRLVRG